ncbi:MAG: DUF1501 domain-containing protein [Pirellulaceae bacterium]
MLPTAHQPEISATRRTFLRQAGLGIGAAALRGLLGEQPALAAERTHFAPQAKRVIYLCQSGAPSQHDLFDYKPELAKWDGQELPESIRGGQRLTGMTAAQERLPLVASPYRFKQHGESGMWLSELLPHTARLADKICLVRSVQTDAINHDPGMTMLLTGHQLPGRPSLGSWLSYGLGSENENLPAFVVLVSQGGSLANQQPLFDRLWSASFLPNRHQGVRLRGGADPVLYLNSPEGISRADRRAMLDVIEQFNQQRLAAVGDPEIETRISQYEMAYRMQMSVPELTDLSREPEQTFERYGPDSRTPGTYAANCLLARRLAQRDVRFVQLFHRGWDQHFHLTRDLPRQCADTDQPTAALIEDLEQLGLLDETLVVWGGEFGRTAYRQGEVDDRHFGRDHHGRCFSMWLAGGGIRGGQAYGETDDFGYNITQNRVPIHDLNATLLHQLGLDHRQLTHRHQSRDFRLTDVHGEVVRGLLR